VHAPGAEDDPGQCDPPTNCNTHLLQNDGMYSMFRPDLTQQGKQATREDAEPLFTIFQAMPIPYVEPVDIANLGVFLASDESRYITGQQIRVDGGFVAQVAERPWRITNFARPIGRPARWAAPVYTAV